MDSGSYSLPPAKRMAYSARYTDSYPQSPIHGLDDGWDLCFEVPSRMPYIPVSQTQSLPMAPSTEHDSTISPTSYPEDPEPHYSPIRQQPRLQLSIPPMPKPEGLHTPLSATPAQVQPRASSVAHGLPDSVAPMQVRTPFRTKGARSTKSTEQKLDPTWKGFIGSTYEALQLLEGCLRGEYRHMPRRAYDREREEVIKSGHVFVFEENASGIKRWTDGVAWSPSRLLPNFLIYREVEAKDHQPGEKKRAIKKRKRSVDEGTTDYEEPLSESGAPIINPNDIALTIPEPERRRLCGSLTDSYNFKSDGLVKKTISVEYKGNVHHIIAYYNLEDILYGRLPRMQDDAILKDTVPRFELLNFHKFQGNPDNPMDDPMRFCNHIKQAGHQWLPFPAAPLPSASHAHLMSHPASAPVPSSALSFYSPSSQHSENTFWPPQPSGPWSQQTPQIQTFNPMANLSAIYHPHPHSRHDSGSHPMTPMSSVGYSSNPVTPLNHFASPFALMPPTYNEAYLQS